MRSRRPWPHPFTEVPARLAHATCPVVAILAVLAFVATVPVALAQSPAGDTQRSDASINWPDAVSVINAPADSHAEDHDVHEESKAQGPQPPHDAHEGHDEHADHADEHADHDSHDDHADSHGINFRLLGISLDGLFAAGTSTERDASLQQLEGGCHDPRKRGFTLRGAEFSMQGAVDPYVDGEMHLVSVIDPFEGATLVELEEAFMSTRSLPGGFQLKAGQFLTEFGAINPTHPHAWAWLDQPIINTRVFGPDGLGGPGVRLSWQAPTEHLSRLYLTMQNANGEMMASYLASEEFFLEQGVGGRPFVYRDVRSLMDLTYTARWENSWASDCKDLTWILGQSVAFGPNATGLQGNTQIYGLDLTRKWSPNKDPHGWPFSVWTSEFIARRYWADSYLGPDPADPNADLALPSERLSDWGFYTQYFYGFRPKWAAGLRYEYVSGSGYSLDQQFQPISRNLDPYRDNRHRLSPLLSWYPTEFSRFNFQYNYDHAAHLASKDAHSFWIGAEFMLGSHPAHKH